MDDARDVVRLPRLIPLETSTTRFRHLGPGRSCEIVFDRANRKFIDHLAGIQWRLEAVMMRARLPPLKLPVIRITVRRTLRHGESIDRPSGHSGNFHCPTPRPHGNRDLHTLSGSHVGVRMAAP